MTFTRGELFLKKPVLQDRAADRSPPDAFFSQNPSLFFARQPVIVTDPGAAASGTGGGGVTGAVLAAGDLEGSEGRGRLFGVAAFSTGAGTVDDAEATRRASDIAVVAGSVDSGGGDIGTAAISVAAMTPTKARATVRRLAVLVQRCDCAARAAGAFVRAGRLGPVALPRSDSFLSESLRSLESALKR